MLYPTELRAQPGVFDPRVLLWLSTHFTQNSSADSTKNDGS
jgi:hypothetical protein